MKSRWFLTAHTNRLIFLRAGPKRRQDRYRSLDVAHLPKVAVWPEKEMSLQCLQNRSWREKLHNAVAKMSPAGERFSSTYWHLITCILGWPELPPKSQGSCPLLLYPFSLLLLRPCPWTRTSLSCPQMPSCTPGSTDRISRWLPL